MSKKPGLEDITIFIASTLPHNKSSHIRIMITGIGILLKGKCSVDLVPLLSSKISVFSWVLVKRFDERLEFRHPQGTFQGLHKLLPRTPARLRL